MAPGYELRGYERGSGSGEASAPLQPDLEEPLLQLLEKFGPDFPKFFGPAMRRVLFGERAPEGDAFSDCVVLGTYAVTSSSDVPPAVVAHCNVWVSAKSKVGLFGCVITHPDHRGKGLARLVCEDVMRKHDAKFPQSLLLLGTGSAQAAKIYQSLGFTHLCGGFNNGLKGYNPEDLGEWILVRRRGLPDPLGLGAGAGFRWETFTYAHWPDCCYLLTADGDASVQKLTAFGPLTSEEGFLRYADETRVLVHGATQRVVGVRVGSEDDFYLMRSFIGNEELCEELRCQESPTAQSEDAGSCMLL